MAEEEATNQPVIRSSADGTVYARSIPTEDSGQKGKTSLFRVGKETDTLIAEYDWYANELHIGGASNTTLIRFGPWQKGKKPAKTHLALGIYRDGKTIREYSTLELQKLGSGISQTAAHYIVFHRRIGFRSLNENAFVYAVEGVSGKGFFFLLDTGALVDKTTTDPDLAPQKKTF